MKIGYQLKTEYDTSKLPKIIQWVFPQPPQYAINYSTFFQVEDKKPQSLQFYNECHVSAFAEDLIFYNRNGFLKDLANQSLK